MELVDDKSDDPGLREYREAHAWPGRLAAVLDAEETINDAVISGSNDRILRTTIRWLTEHRRDRPDDGLLVVIGWSGAMRREFYVDGGYHQLIPYQRHPHPDVDRLGRLYRDLAWHESESGDRLATQALSLQAFLRTHRVPYLFFDAIESSFDSLGRAGLAGSGCLDDIDLARWYRFGEPDGSMADVLRASGTAWNGRHPARDGHELWAHKLGAHIMRHGLIQRPDAGPPTPTAVRERPFAARRRFRAANRDFLYP
ncbi:hypothetical protein B1H18_01545 [Streptomyces tsukubensis]|uniref:Uncharacterized protein n=2 Tax=Streptomyces tsukubensis TaxID=83656 RepID=A0A1V4AG64_9ACTN|nr:hypothetical protein B1H18_01545 [Streptomyces tsukubensis]